MYNKIVSKLKGKPFKIDTDIIHNKYVLYVILIISIMNLILLSNSQNYESVAIFFLVGILTYYFNKNMIIVLSISLCITNLLKYGLKIRINEGFDENEDENNKENIDNKDITENDKTTTDDNTKENTDKTQEKKKKENTDKTKLETKPENKENSQLTSENKKQEETQNKKNDNKVVETPNETEINNIKTADMVTSLNLNNDNKGLEGLENQTAQLINTQKKLIENMKKLEPMLSDAQNFIDRFQNIGIR